MIKVKQSIYSIILLLSSTAVAQVPATELTFPKPNWYSEFGTEVAINGEYTIGTSQFENDVYANGNASTYYGTVRLFKNNQYKRTYTFGNTSIGIGAKNSASISANCIAVGAYDYSIGGTKCGAVFLANMLNTGDYASSLNYYLYPDAADMVNNLKFGQSVSANGDWVAVGAPGRNSNTGGVVMFQRTGYLQWIRRGWLPVTGMQNGSLFGSIVSISGDQMIVRSQYSIHIYKLINGTWTSVAQFTDNIWGFGKVDITTNLVIASGTNSNGNPVILVYKNNANNVWSLSQTIQAPAGSLGTFGLNLAVSNQNMVVSNFYKAYYYQLQGNNFVLIGSMYIPTTNSATGRTNKQNVGAGIDIHNDRIVVSASNSNYVNNNNAGAVFTDFFWNGWANSNNLRVDESEGAVEVNSELSLFPNPSASNVSVNGTAEILKATAINSLGETIPVAYSGKTLQVESFKAGIYQLKVETTEGSFTTKFVKQ